GGTSVFLHGSFVAAHDVRVEGGSAGLAPGSGSVAGRLVVSGGELQLASASPFAVAGGVEVGPGATLAARHTLVADLYNAGTLRLGSDLSPGSFGTVLTLEGDYTQASTGTLVAPANQYFVYRFDVTGLATLAGTFRLLWLEPGVPVTVAGDAVRYGSRSGGFGSLDLPPLVDAHWETFYDLEPYFPNSFSLFTVSDE
ncbi:MAG: hypothetical protein ACRC33_21635, partial [Gemmataceae bacterium]